jgi:hypothetical protein
MRPSQGLAVDCHHLVLGSRCLGLDSGHEIALELSRIQADEHPPNRIVRWDAPGQRQEGPRPRLPGVPEDWHGHPVVGPAQDGAQGEGRKPAEPMNPRPAHPGIGQRGKMHRDAARRRSVHPEKPLRRAPNWLSLHNPLYVGQLRIKSRHSRADM